VIRVMPFSAVQRMGSAIACLPVESPNVTSAKAGVQK
jgi:hypothetical protein